MSKKAIGETGESINNSIAGRSANITGDIPRILKYDPHVKKMKQQVIREGLWALLFLVVTVALIVFGYPWWSIIPGLLFLWKFLMFVFSLNIKPQTAYESGLLIPATIVQTSPIRLVAMADVSLSEEREMWGMKVFSVEELPGHEIRLGEQVPCCALFGARSFTNNLWTEMDIRPLVWSTENKEQIREAIRVIGDEEWSILEKLANSVFEHENSKLKPGKEKMVFYNKQLAECVEGFGYGFVPVALLGDVYWGIYGGKYDKYDDFIEAVQKYNETFDKEWYPDEVVVYNKEMNVLFEYWDEEKEDTEEVLLSFEADDDEKFTVGEILYKIHNTSVEYLEEDDKHFFEGLTLYQEKNRSGIPLYLMSLGS